MRSIIMTLAVAALLTTAMPLAAAFGSTSPAPKTPFTPVQGEGEIQHYIAYNVAVFADSDPWGNGKLATALSNIGATVTTFGSADMGVADLSGFQKVVIASVQTGIFYQAFLDNAAYFQAFVNNGGNLEIHAADYSGDGWPASAIWDGVTYHGYDRDGYAQDGTALLDPGHTIFTVPHAVTAPEMTGWNWDFHGVLGNTGGWNTVIVSDPQGDPVWIEKASGAGCVTITTQTVEWDAASSAFLENMLSYYGCASTPPPVPELSSILLAGAGLGIVGLAVAMRRRSA